MKKILILLVAATISVATVSAVTSNREDCTKECKTACTDKEKCKDKDSKNCSKKCDKKDKAAKEKKKAA